MALSVPGLGDATIVDLLSEVGSFSLYENPRQLIKLAGLTLRENSSGQHKGQKHISKRGRRTYMYSFQSNGTTHSSQRSV